MEIPVNDTDDFTERKQHEHRQHPRTRVTVTAELQQERALLRVKTADLSIGGLYVEMMFTLEIGTKLNIVFWINDVKVSTGGVVVTRDIQVGNGIEFTDMAPGDRERLRHFLMAEAATGEAEGQKM
jgi:hypothetical protein